MSVTITPGGASTKSILPAGWSVPEEIGGRLGDTGGRQRALAANGHLLLVLHELPGDDDKIRIGRFFCASPTEVGDRTISARGFNPFASM